MSLGAQSHDRGTFAASWLVTAVAAVGMLSALVVLTADLGVTSGTLRHGVGGIEQLVGINDAAVRGTGAVAPTQAALDRSNVEVATLADSMDNAIGSLDRMTSDLGQLSRSLGGTDQPLAGVLDSVAQSRASDADTEAALGRTAVLLGQADQTARELGPLLDETEARSARLERKLRILRLIPVPVASRERDSGEG